MNTPNDRSDPRSTQIGSSRTLPRLPDLLTVVTSVCLFSLLGFSTAAAARQIQVPLQINHAFIERALRDQVFTGANDTLRLNDNGTGCQFLELANPRVSARGDQLRVITNGRLRVGAPFNGRCLYALQWDGQLELIEAVELVANNQVRVRVIEENVLTTAGQPDRASDALWQWLRSYVQPAFNVMVVDLATPVEQIRALLQVVLVAQHPADLQRLLESFQVSALDTNAAGILSTLSFDVPDTAPSAPLPPEPLLDDQEIRAFQARLEQLDAFLTFTIKQSALDAADNEAVKALLEILLDSRYRLLDALDHPVKGGVDPVRSLFTSTWTQLAGVMRTMSHNGDSALAALNYITFIAAADALQLLDALGPGFAIDLSVDGLRRLARILAPAGMPGSIQYNESVDPELRKLFNFPPEREAPLGFTAPWRFSLIASAHAAGGTPVEVWARLNNWVPKPQEINQYLPMANQVLAHAVQRRLSGTSLDKRYHSIYRALVMATAWQESCWRQFVNNNGRREPLRSGSGDLGIMQINARVWRGLYNLHDLRWNIEQNARAGAEILLHYMENYAIKKGEHRTTGNVENLARSTYAAYNGGPRQFDRYRRRNAPAYAKKVDALFYDKYRAVRNGNELAVKRCYQ